MSEPSCRELDRSSPPCGDRSDRAAQPVLQGQSDLHDQPGLRHLGTSQVRQRTGSRFRETINDYLDIFQELQIDPMFHEVFWTSVIYRYRQGSRHAPLLKRGTVASIKTMSDDILRAYGWRIWGDKSGWRGKLAEGEERLLYHKDGPNTRLHEILAKLWWRMRELVYEPKCGPKQRKRAPKLGKRASGGEMLSEAEETYLGDVDDHTPVGTDSEAGTPLAPSKIARAKAIAKLDKIAGTLPAPDPGKFLTFQQTEEEIINLLERLHDLRLASNPDVFERLWVAHIGRVEELEAPIEAHGVTRVGRQVNEWGDPLSPTRTGTEFGDRQVGPNTVMEDVVPAHGSSVGNTCLSQVPRNQAVPATSHDAAAVPFPAQLLSDEAIKKRIYPNLSSEPFNTVGNPIPPSLTQQHYLPPTLPKLMSIWIMTSPPQAAYPNRAYHHPAAPVQLQDQVALFTQVMERAEHIASKDVQGYALSYGWCDVSRWVEKTVGQGSRGLGSGEKPGESEGERLGWQVFQRDLVEAAKAGVMIWRMKVLVVKKGGRLAN